MNDLVRSYWAEKHEKYTESGYAAKPSIFAQEILEHLPKSGKLLDLGAGQGQDSRLFANKGFEVTSTDLTPEPLKISKQLAEKEGLSITLQEVDLAKELPFENDSFDVVYSHMALHYFDEQTTQQLFSEIYRVLKIGGVFASLLNTTQDPETNRSDFEKIEEDLYKTPVGIYKRFFSVDSLKEFTYDYFEPIMLDSKGKTYKDDIETLVRFVGRKK